MFKYFSGKLTPGFTALYSGRMLQFAGTGIIGLFLPVYLMIQFDYRPEYVMLWYLAGHLAYTLLLPWGAQFLNRFGLRRSLRVSVFFDAMYLGSIFLIAVNPGIFIAVSLVLATLARLTFWLPYHVDLAKFTDKLNRGREVSIMRATKAFLGIVMPIVSGFLLAYFGFSVVFIIAITVYLLSGIPFLLLPRTRERFEWKYRQTVRNFFAEKNRRLVASNVANGAENAAALVMWPIFIWQLLEGDYASVGMLSGLIVFVGVILQLVVGKYTDRIDKRKLLHWGSGFYAGGWLAKIFVLSGFHIFLVGAYHKLAQIFKDTPFDTLNYEILADQGHYVDEYTVLKEMAVQLGKALILALAIIVVSQFGLNWTFVLAALASLLVNLL